MKRFVAFTIILVSLLTLTMPGLAAGYTKAAFASFLEARFGEELVGYPIFCEYSDESGFLYYLVLADEPYTDNMINGLHSMAVMIPILWDTLGDGTDLDMKFSYLDLEGNGFLLVNNSTITFVEKFEATDTYSIDENGVIEGQP